MTKFLTAAAVLAVTLSCSGVASAVPLAPLSANDTAGVIRVAQGCGPGFARGPMGRCRPMGYGRPFVRPPVVVRPGRICPPGFSFRFGRCRPF